MSNPKGYFEKILVMDAETSGIAFSNVDPSFNVETGDLYQAVSWGLVVADAETLKPIDKLYVEIQWNGESVWDFKAEGVHGLSKKHLMEHGVDEETAALDICEFVVGHFGPGQQVACGGHNIASFDIFFMRRLLNQFGIMFKTGNRFVDTHSIGFGAFHTFNSDELFKLFGVVRKEHNALEDAMASLKVMFNTRMICKSLVDG